MKSTLAKIYFKNPHPNDAPMKNGLFTSFSVKTSVIIRAKRKEESVTFLNK